jgi:hypothetical protein
MLAMRSLRPVTMKFFSLHSRFILVLLSVLSLRETTANDECVDAIVVSSFPVTFTGNTSQATVDFPDPTDNLRNLTCGIPATSAGIWYRLEGNNQFVKAQVTDIDTASFSTALFTNTCDDLQCLLASDYSLTNQRTQPTSEWFAQEGETYFLHVTSVGETPGGAFDLEIEVCIMGKKVSSLSPNRVSRSMPIVVSTDTLTRILAAYLVPFSKFQLEDPVMIDARLLLVSMVCPPLQLAIPLARGPLPSPQLPTRNAVSRNRPVDCIILLKALTGVWQSFLPTWRY